MLFQRGGHVSTGEIDVEAAALALPPGPRERLARRLLASLSEEESLRATWDDEIRNRVTELETGKARTQSAEEVLGRALDLLKR